MKTKLLVISFLALMLCSQPIFAGAIGLSGSTIKYGFATRASAYNIDSSHGQSEVLNVIQPYNFVVTDWLSSGSSYWLEIYHASYRFKPTETKVGQQLDKSGVRFSIMKNTFVSKYFQPWYGLGLDVAHSKFSKRHTVDFEGFRANEYNDENKLDLGLLVQTHSAWDLTKDWSTGVKGEYRLALSESIQGATFEFFVLYRSR